ncbi:hypothetical protein Tco_0645644 [Tanacetum coccineum]
MKEAVMMKCITSAMNFESTISDTTGLDVNVSNILKRGRKLVHQQFGRLIEAVSPSRSRDRVVGALTVTECLLPHKRQCVRKPFPSNSYITHGHMQLGEVDLNPVSGDGQPDQTAYVDSDWHGNVEFTRMILDYAAFWLSPRHSSLLPVLFLLKTPLASFTTTLTAIPSDFLGDSPATCRWGYLSLATCRWGMIAGERSLGIRSPATRWVPRIFQSSN